jgi:hypothetical protein
LLHHRAVLLEQAPRLRAGVVGLVERLADALPALVDDPLHRPERETPQHEERDREADERPDHQSDPDLDQRIGGEERREHQTST